MEDNNSLLNKKIELINSEEFNSALESAVECKKDILTSCKNREKDNYSRFLEIMLMTDKTILEIADKKKKNRTDEENNKLKNFKSETSKMYKTVCDLIAPEDLEEGELSKVQKLVQKVSRVVKIMSYIGHNEIEDEFNKAGIVLKYESLENSEAFENDTIKTNINDVFDIGKNIKEDIKNNKSEIEERIYTQSVPIDLQFDKSENPVGLKASDFSKLVALKTKISMATEEQKEKVEESVENAASDYVFQNNRNEIMNKKILDLITE